MATNNVQTLYPGQQTASFGNIQTLGFNNGINTIPASQQYGQFVGTQQNSGNQFIQPTQNYSTQQLNVPMQQINQVPQIGTTNQLLSPQTTYGIGQSSVNMIQPIVASNVQIPTANRVSPISYTTPDRVVSQRILQSPQQQIQINQPVIQQVQQQAQVVHNIEHVPVIHELHHVNRPINVVSVDEIEGPWRSKILLLEKQLIELQLMLKKGGKTEIQTTQVIVEDEGRIKQLQLEIERLHGILEGNGVEIANLENQIHEANYNLENAEEQASSQVEAQEQELAAWKKKFSELNKKFHDIEEEITLTETEIESIQKRKVVQTKTTAVKTTTSRVGGMESEVRKSGYSNRNY